MVAYSYIRFSTARQAQGDSFRRQYEPSIKYCRDNNLELDNTLNLADMGVSAYDGSNVETGNLGVFLKAIEAGKVEPGSVLLVESLDRISRDKILNALGTFIGILSNEIKIVTLLDGREYTYKSVNENPQELIISITILTRAHEESKTKSERVTAAFDRKREGLDKRIFTAKAPAWLMAKPDKSGFDIIDSRAAIVKLIFKMSTDGQGRVLTVKHLNSKGFPTFGKSKKWNLSYVQKILTNRAVLGEYQPMKYVQTTSGKKRREPVGDIFPNYYPRIVDDERFYASHEKRKSRKNKGGRMPKNNVVSNLFTHIVKCGYCNESMVRQDKGSRSSGPMLICDNARLGNECKYKTWNIEQFEESFLEYVYELKVPELFEDPEISSKLVEISSKIATCKGRFKVNYECIERFIQVMKEIRSEVATIAREIKKMENENAEFRNTLNALQDEKSSLENIVTNTKLTIESIQLLLGNKNPIGLNDRRARLKIHIKELVERIYVFPYVPKGEFTHCFNELDLYLLGIGTLKARFFGVKFINKNTRLVVPDQGISTPMSFATYEVIELDDGSAVIDLKSPLKGSLLGK